MLKVFSLEKTQIDPGYVILIFSTMTEPGI